jgi:hypothetical protein
LEQREGSIPALIRLVENGNVNVANLLAPHVRRLDGGELEDALRAYGILAGENPEALFAIQQSGGLTDQQVKDAVTMLPLQMSDDYPAQLQELEKRKDALQRVSDPGKDAFMAEIEEFTKVVEAAARSEREGD